MTRQQRGMAWDEIDALRRLVPVAVDRHLDNWARWSRAYRGQIGHRKRSAGFASGGLSSVEDMESECDGWSAEIADTVIDVLPIEMRIAIAAVYAGGRWQLRDDLLAPTLIEAAEAFWLRAKRRGLM